ncbi:hypothetical protein C8Q72DRAFT_885596 [Fomitopsis betulina]|nr:hypothetical protein C8Q72DRAFT_885596 [Fomitopsis betulina]
MEDLDFNELHADGHANDVDDLWDADKDLNKASRVDAQAKVQPIKMMLSKLRKISMLIHCSPTLLLPAWKRAIKAINKLKLKKLPHHVHTRWNLMFRMLDVMLQYQSTIKRMTEAQGNNLHQWELDN